MNRITQTLTGIASCAFFGIAVPAYAGEADDILKKVESNMAQSKDQVSQIKMTIEDASGNTKIRVLKTQQKGKTLRLIKFTEPAEVKGVGFLVLSDDEMYIYMPEFGKVRRIASHVKNDNFMGTDFSYSDMGSSDYTQKFDATLKSKDKSFATIELIPKKNADTQYGKLSMRVDLARSLPVEVEFFDKKGTLWKRMTSENIEKIGTYWVPRKMTMRDLKKKHGTLMEITSIEFDTGLKDGDFSQRMLKRSR